MKYIIGIIILLNVSIVSFSQKKVIVDPSEIDTMEVILYKVKGKELTRLDPSKDYVEKKDKIRLQISVTLKDGKTLTTPLKGKEGLDIDQFGYDAVGAYSPRTNTDRLVGVLIKAATIPRGTFIVGEYYRSIPIIGEPGVTLVAWHNDDKENFTHTYIKKERPKNMTWDIHYNREFHGEGRGDGLDIIVTVKLDSFNMNYPLSVEIKCPEFPHASAFWVIDPETEKVRINTPGNSGFEGDWTTTAYKGGDGDDGSDGGDVKITFVGKAKQYESIFYIDTSGGNGGKGGKGTNAYGASGRNGRDGKITVLYE